jgi:hypothetical protein
MDLLQGQPARKMSHDWMLYGECIDLVVYLASYTLHHFGRPSCDQPLSVSQPFRSQWQPVAAILSKARLVSVCQECQRGLSRINCGSVPLSPLYRVASHNVPRLAWLAWLPYGGRFTSGTSNPLRLTPPFPLDPLTPLSNLYCGLWYGFCGSNVFKPPCESTLHTLATD